MRWSQITITFLLFTFLAGCSVSPPKRTEDLCHIFTHNTKWHKEARRSAKRWNADMPTMMSIMNQESSFIKDARPKWRRFLGIPYERLSSAYGYAQATDGTFEWYKKSTGQWSARRDRFDDAIDFIGWYNNKSRIINDVDKDNAIDLYINYHQGHGGARKFNKKSDHWLLGAAKKVDTRTTRYKRQLSKCKSLKY